MKVSGLTFVKNAVKYGYPLLESVRSVLPLVDEMIICAGDSEDTTDQMMEELQDTRIKIKRSVWDKDLKKGGEVLAVETNKALDATAPDADWLFYIQADEVVHEKYYTVIREAMEKYKDDHAVEGLLFHYHHFYGSFRFIADSRKWYSKEIRVIRNDKQIRSYRDAQGFRKNGRKLKVKLIDAYIYHYGWTRSPLIMYQKAADFDALWHDAENKPTLKDQKKHKQEFDYSVIDSVQLFEGTHPAVMKELVAKEDWTLSLDIHKKNFKNLKHRLLYFIWKTTGWRAFEYRNYIKI